jgi:hypothetical protein
MHRITVVARFAGVGALEDYLGASGWLAVPWRPDQLEAVWRDGAGGSGDDSLRHCIVHVSCPALRDRLSVSRVCLSVNNATALDLQCACGCCLPACIEHVTDCEGTCTSRWWYFRPSRLRPFVRSLWGSLPVLAVTFFW